MINQTLFVEIFGRNIKKVIDAFAQLGQIVFNKLEF
jgi:hypothetical protein